MAEPDLTETITSLEDQTWKVLSENGAALLPFLASDCQMLFPFGMMISSTSDPSIRDVMTSDAFGPWKSFSMSHVVVTPVGSDGAVINYKVKAMRPDPDGEDIKFHALITSVWRKESQPGTWKMCSHQQTPYELSIRDLA